MTRIQDKRSLFRGWSRLRLHAASINAAQAALAPVATGARGSQAISMRVEAAAETRKGVEAWEAAAGTEKRAAEVDAEAEEAECPLREQGRQHAKRVVRDSETCEG